MLEKIIRVSNASLVQLQGKQLLIHQQQSILDSLQQQLMEIGNVQHNCATLPTNNEVQQEGTFSMTNQSAKQYVLNVGSMYLVEIYQKYEREDPEGCLQINKSIAQLFTKFVHGIYILSPQRDERNQSCFTSMPPSVPSQLLNLSTFEFTNLLREEDVRLQHSFNVEYIGQLEREFNDFKDECRRDTSFKELVAIEKKTLNEAWDWLSDKYPKLMLFFGALGSVFPGTSSVESDFSIIGFEKDEYRTCLTNFALEGIMHCKQRENICHLELLLNN